MGNNQHTLNEMADLSSIKTRSHLFAKSVRKKAPLDDSSGAFIFNDCLGTIIAHQTDDFAEDKDLAFLENHVG